MPAESHLGEMYSDPRAETLEYLKGIQQQHYILSSEYPYFLLLVSLNSYNAYNLRIIKHLCSSKTNSDQNSKDFCIRKH